MKYLPDDQLAKVTYPVTENVKSSDRFLPASNLITKRPEFSFATLEYMKKYNLLANSEVG